MSGINTTMFVTEQKGVRERYEKIRTLGEGAFGVVLLCKEKSTGALRAVKKINCNHLDKGKEKAAMSELETLKRLDHPHCMRIYEYLQERGFFYIVAEALEGGELFDEIVKRKRFTERDAAHVIWQTLSGVAYLHANDIVHRDLKPENLLLANKVAETTDMSKCHIKLIDFGLSTTFTSKKLIDRKGTSYYIAPEVLERNYNEKCDVWSTGVIMYILLAGVPPFNGKNNVQILDSVRTKKVLDYPPKHWSAVSPEALEVVQMMLERDVSKRPAASALVKHAWFQKNIQGVESQTKSSLDRAIHQMRQFQGAVKLRQAALLYLASKLTDTDEVQELKDIFQSMDLNHDGRLDRYELEQALKAFSNKEDVAEVQNLVDEVMGGMDLDHTGTVEYSEFLAAAVDHSRLLTSSRLESAFKLFDLDGSGFIELDELRKILDGQVSDADWEAICSEVDQDNNKQIDFDEFKHMMNESTWL